MDFYRRMEEVFKCVPRGRVVTYGQIALLCGAPRNARQVGYALRCGRAGDVPAHRVVNSRGILSGAGAFSLPGQQRMMLEKEGVRVETCEEGDRVDLARYGWKNSMAEAEALCALFGKLGI